VVLFTHIISRNHLTSHHNIEVSKLTNRDIQRILRQCFKEILVADISRDFHVTR